MDENEKTESEIVIELKNKYETEIETLNKTIKDKDELIKQLINQPPKEQAKQEKEEQEENKELTEEEYIKQASQRIIKKLNERRF